MSYYTLYNKRLSKRLTRPQIGMWFTSSLEEATSMLKACHEYVNTFGDPNLKDDFVIIDVETGKECQ